MWNFIPYAFQIESFLEKMIWNKRRKKHTQIFIYFIAFSHRSIQGETHNTLRQTYENIQAMICSSSCFHCRIVCLCAVSPSLARSHECFVSIIFSYKCAPCWANNHTDHIAVWCVLCDPMCVREPIQFNVFTDSDSFLSLKTRFSVNRYLFHSSSHLIRCTPFVHVSLDVSAYRRFFIVIKTFLMHSKPFFPPHFKANGHDMQHKSITLMMTIMT